MGSPSTRERIERPTGGGRSRESLSMSGVLGLTDSGDPISLSPE